MQTIIDVAAIATFGIVTVVIAYPMLWLTTRTRKVGGLTFLRVGRVQASFCICRA